MLNTYCVFHGVRFDRTMESVMDQHYSCPIQTLYPNEQYFKKPRLFKIDVKRYPNHPKPWTLELWRGPGCCGIRSYKKWQDAVDYLANVESR